MINIVKNYISGFISFSSKRLNRVLILVISLFITLGVIGYWVIGERNQDFIINQQLQKQQIVTHAGANSIENYFNLIESAILTVESQINSSDEDTQFLLDDFVGKWANTSVAGIVVTDADGVVIKSSNKIGQQAVGTLISERDFFLWAKKASSEEVYIGSPVLPDFGPLAGQYIIPITTPIIEDGEFEGLINIAVSLSDLTSRYITPLKFSDTTRIYLINNQGDILQGPHEKLIGVNYFDYLQANPYQGSQEVLPQMKGAVSDTDEGTMKLVLPNERIGGLDTFLIAYAHVILSDTVWTLAIATPIDEALQYYAPFRIRGISVLIFVIFLIISYSAFLIVSVRLTKKRSYLKGLKHAQKLKS